MSTASVEVPRDSFGKQLRPEAHAAREQRIQELVSKGHDRWSAENVTDGRPSWSQRINNVDTRSSEARRSVEDASERSQQHIARVAQAEGARLNDLEDELSNLKASHEDFKQKALTSRLLIEKYADILDRSRKFLQTTDGMVGPGVSYERKQAQAAIEKHEPKLEKERRNLKNFEWAVENVAARIKSFPVSELKQLRAVQRPRF